MHGNKHPYESKICILTGSQDDDLYFIGKEDGNKYIVPASCLSAYEPVIDSEYIMTYQLDDKEAVDNNTFYIKQAKIGSKRLLTMPFFNE